MDKFAAAWGFTGRAEGGWQNNGDRGGETMFGIARNSHPKWPGWVMVDVAKANANFPICINGDAALLSMALTFYREEFWNAVCGDALPLPLAVAVFDQAVNFGPPPAIKELQAVLGVTVDGIMGPVTVRAAVEMGFPAVESLLRRRVLRYFDDVKKYPEDAKWLPGWMIRVVDMAVAATKFEMRKGEL